MKKYWDNRYKTGGTSGVGSIGNFRKWKWEIIKKYLKIWDVIDIGCGDLNFWQNKNCENYIGIDFSKIIIERNKIKAPSWKFICSDAEKKLNISAENVFCLDVLFHILDENTYIKILKNLMLYSKKYIFLYTWSKNPFKEGNTDNIYQKYRDFNKYLSVFKNFKLISVKENKFKPIGKMYIFKKVYK